MKCIRVIIYYTIFEVLNDSDIFVFFIFAHVL